MEKSETKTQKETEKEMWQRFYDQAKKYVDDTIPDQIRQLNEEYILNKEIMNLASEKLEELKE